ncbi:hypothetical protein [Arthrobacter sp. ES3-54]|jgi:hypothetical protein|uniref:hypothetical protein n=1 Tax=Arthrobacter sp. ES3-54 TaxID=1502991 RepID=UPI00240652EC|nr:hypothetical protein [Arthrobacter sp. ES3-54]MDF9752784.1 hypothetical protein [Arthrobacter sp. ES3-54]
MGKEYNKVTEIVKMGMESLFTGTNGGLIGIGTLRPGPGIPRLHPGAVATAGGRNSHETPLSAWLK